MSEAITCLSGVDCQEWLNDGSSGSINFSRPCVDGKEKWLKGSHVLNAFIPIDQQKTEATSVSTFSEKLLESGYHLPALKNSMRVDAQLGIWQHLIAEGSANTVGAQSIRWDIATFHPDQPIEWLDVKNTTLFYAVEVPEALDVPRAESTLAIATEHPLFPAEIGTYHSWSNGLNPTKPDGYWVSFMANKDPVKVFKKMGLNQSAEKLQHHIDKLPETIKKALSEVNYFAVPFMDKDFSSGGLRFSVTSPQAKVFSSEALEKIQKIKLKDSFMGNAGVGADARVSIYYDISKFLNDMDPTPVDPEDFTIVDAMSVYEQLEIIDEHDLLKSHFGIEYTTFRDEILALAFAEKMPATYVASSVFIHLASEIQAYNASINNGFNGTYLEALHTPLPIKSPRAEGQDALLEETINQLNQVHSELSRYDGLLKWHPSTYTVENQEKIKQLAAQKEQLLSILAELSPAEAQQWKIEESISLVSVFKDLIFGEQPLPSVIKEAPFDPHAIRYSGRTNELLIKELSLVDSYIKLEGERLQSIDHTINHDDGLALDIEFDQWNQLHAQRVALKEEIQQNLIASNMLEQYKDAVKDIELKIASPDIADNERERLLTALNDVLILMLHLRAIPK